MDVDLPNVLKRCLSAPIINNLASSQGTKAATTSAAGMTSTTNTQTSNSSSREASPAQIMNIFTPRARRYSASFASIGAANANNSPCPTPRVSQLRQEECIDINSREINHEREVHSAMQISQSWEDLTIVAENWSCKSEDLSNPLQVVLPSGITSCSSPSPTSRTGMRLPYGLSPSPTRRTFATRRSMSPIAMRPSQLGPVKRKFELEDNSTNTYSPPPLKKIFTDSRGPSPICQSPSSICPSPDSGTYDGRITPKLFVSRLYNTTNSSSSLCSSPMVPSPMMDTGIDLQSNNSSSPANTISSSSTEPACISAFEVDVESVLKSNSDVKSFNDETLMDNDKMAEITKTDTNSREADGHVKCNPNENNSTCKESNFSHLISSTESNITNENNTNIIKEIGNMNHEKNM